MGIAVERYSLRVTLAKGHRGRNEGGHQKGQRCAWAWVRLSIAGGGVSNARYLIDATKDARKPLWGKVHDSGLRRET